MAGDIKKLMAELTLEEKAGFCSGTDYWHFQGIKRLGIPAIRVADGPHGVRKQREEADPLGIYRSIQSTCFPSAAGLASSWNRKLIEKVGIALGMECQAENVAILLGPGVNIKRSPLCGRNFEYFSEDPYLSSEMAVHYIRGIQSQGVGTSIKHYAANNQEYRRMTVDAVIDERVLREIYLASFEEAVRQTQPWTVMCSYNKVNGEFATENEFLLTKVLREEWGFKGIVISDWGAVNERVDGLKAGLDVEMPTSKGIGEKKILSAIKNGELSEEVLDQAVERILTIIMKAADSNQLDAKCDKEGHHRLAREAARESMVLLKNDEKILPLKKEGRIAVIGEMATLPRYQGLGSSRVNPVTLDIPLDEIRKTAEEATTTYARGYTLKNNDIDGDLVKEAQNAAAEADVAIIFAGLPARYESEAYDRIHLRIPDNHRFLIEAVAEVQPNLVVVLCNGAPVEMPWLDDVKGLLECYLGGQAMGGAVADLLFGDANPSGKLAETFPEDVRHNPSFLHFPGEEDKVEYKEGLFVGYRYYDTKNIQPLFPFGFGLSYTTFDLSDLILSKNEMTAEETVDVTVTVKNTGDRAGKEVVQFYVQDVQSTVVRPFKELKAFEKIELQPGEEKTITVTLGKRAFAFYNPDIEDWYVEHGAFDILVGNSSDDIILKRRLTVSSPRLQLNRVHRNTTVGDLLAEPYLAPTVREMLASIKISEHSPFANTEGGAESNDMLRAMMKFMPLRALVAFNPESFTEELLHELINDLNEKIIEAGPKNNGVK